MIPDRRVIIRVVSAVDSELPIEEGYYLKDSFLVGSEATQKLILVIAPAPLRKWEHDMLQKKEMEDEMKNITRR